MKSTTANYRQQFEETKAWGILTTVDLHACDPERIRSAQAIEKFVIQLCDLIEMKRFGDPIIVNFGEDERVAGYSLAQLIETSLISGHFANQTNNVYLDIFSCKYYDPTTVAEFAKEFFKGTEYNINVVLRK